MNWRGGCMTGVSSPVFLQRGELNSNAAQLRKLVEQHIAAGSIEGILFSGGLDTSIVAAVAAAHGRRLKGFFVSVVDGPGQDEPFALMMAERAGLELEVLRPTLDQLLDRMPQLIRLLRTFD